MTHAFLCVFSLTICVSHCSPLQHTATHCNTLQHTATHCNTLQHTATHCNTGDSFRAISPSRNPRPKGRCCSVLRCVAVCCSVLQLFCANYLAFAQSPTKRSHVFLAHVAVSCSVLQCVTVCYNVLQCVVTCCNVLQYVAVCCGVLQCVAVCCRNTNKNIISA